MRRIRGSGSVYRPPGTQHYWISYYVAGKRVRESTKTNKPNLAATVLRNRLSALDRGELPNLPNETKWDDLADLIREDYRVQGRRSSSRLELSLRHLDLAFGGLRAQSINTERISGYVASRLQEGAARATVNRELSALKRAFRLGLRAGKVILAPHVTHLQERNVRQGFFERADLKKLQKALPKDLRNYALVAYLTGWRTSELLTRKWSHIDLKARWMRLEPGETKSGEGRMFPLFPELLGALAAQKRARGASEWVFHHNGYALFHYAKGRLVPSRYLREKWTEATKAAGLEGKLRHDFRRTAARDLLRSGVSVPVVMKAMGWQSAAMLHRYAITEPKDLVEAGRKRARLR